MIIQLPRSFRYFVTELRGSSLSALTLLQNNHAQSLSFPTTTFRGTSERVVLNGMSAHNRPFSTYGGVEDDIIVNSLNSFCGNQPDHY